MNPAVTAILSDSVSLASDCQTISGGAGAAEEEDNDPETVFLKATLSALQLQSQQLDQTCSRVESQNRALDSEIEALFGQLSTETKELEELEKSKEGTVNPLTKLSLEIHTQKMELKELNRKGEALRASLDHLNTSNTEAEHRIYDLDDLVWKKSREIDDLQTRLTDSVPFSRLQKTLCKSCLDSLSEALTHQATSSLNSVPSSRRQASLGTMFPNKDAFSLYSLWKLNLVVGNEEASEQPRSP